MREIKFRGLNEDGFWYYGDLVSGNDKYFIRFSTDGFIREKAIAPETTGQCTGLKDGDGREIYEGDIIRHTETGRVYAIGYGCFHAGFELRNGNVIKGILEIDYADLCEVIGNIHENPELLKGG